MKPEKATAKAAKKTLKKQPPIRHHSGFISTTDWEECFPEDFPAQIKR